MKIRRTQRGFTLIELMIVVAIIGILSTIAIPRIIKTLTRTRQVEAVQTVSAIERSLKEYLNREGEYPRVSGAQNPAQEEPGKAMMDYTQPGWSLLNFHPENAYRYRYEFITEADDQGRYTIATIRAFGDSNGDGSALELLREYRNGDLITQNDLLSVD